MNCPGHSIQLGTVADTYPTSDNLAEKLCRFYKHAMRTSGRYFEPVLQLFVTWVVESFAKSSHSSYLYCFSVCVGEYGYNPSHLSGFRYNNCLLSLLVHCTIYKPYHSLCIYILPRRPNMIELLHSPTRQVMEHLTNITFSLLKDYEAFVSNPDVVEVTKSLNAVLSLRSLLPSRFIRAAFVVTS